MKKTIALVTAVLLLAVPVLAGNGTAYSLMPGACPLEFSPQHEPESDFGGLPGRRPALAGLILGGLAGNLAGAIGLGCAGSLVRISGENLVPPGILVGVPVGSVFGSALGVCLAGNTHYWRGRFGSALLGSTLGLFSACLICAAFPDTFQQLGLVYFAVLPPLGAAVFFNSTLDRRFSRTQGGLFSFSRGRLRMGVPGLDVRPVSVPGVEARPELQFKVKVLSVEL